jgi:imidazolonepropionase-like amidohydrolase
MRWLVLWFGIVLACFTTAAARTQTNTSSEILVFTNVNVVDTRNGVILDNRVVEIQGDRIAAVGKIGLVDSSPHIRVINASGKYLIPGLWDMNVRTASSSTVWDERIIYPLFVAHGVMGVRDMGGDSDLLEPRRRRIDQGELLGPHIIPAAALSFGDPSIAITTFKARGTNLLTVPADIPRNAYFVLAAETAKQNMQLVGPVPNSITVAEAAQAGQRSMERLSGILLACSMQEEELRRLELEAWGRHDEEAFAALAARASATYDPRKAWSLFVKLADTNTWQVPALTWSQAASTGLDPSNDVELKYVPSSIRHGWELRRMLSPTEAEVIKQHADREVELVKAMGRAGVQFLTGSDGPDRDVYPGSSLHSELEWLVKAGLTPAQALQSATINPAIFLVKLDKFGVVEAGHAADLVLLDGNPLEDIRNTRQIAGIVRAGKYFSRADLDQLLAQIAQRAAKE